MKYEWKKQEKELYGTKTAPAVVTVPEQNYIMISGEGNPNDADFSNRVSALYSVAYAVKMAYKKAAQGGIDDFAMYPLEGVWQKIEGDELVKENLRYTLMIRQRSIARRALTSARRRTVRSIRARRRAVRIPMLRSTRRRGTSSTTADPSPPMATKASMPCSISLS